ncbi:hypothetical protein [Sulfurimonas sp.]|uniref:hypothetical protein n=1 Tax=Sulfurimonas sp. TaxID=2022749 RepID=UPI0025E70BA1|nr:hypothetical protein [Sulfurimonas sp.]MDD5157749.1 hypothetical protein [Sulfurimonas sp.]
MKPLLAKDIKPLLARFSNFTDGELRSIEIISPTTIKITLTGQDSARGFDWLTVCFEFSGVHKAKLLENSKLSLVDMSDGINIIFEDNSFAFGVGDYKNLLNIKNSICFLISCALKYEEGAF